MLTIPIIFEVQLWISNQVKLVNWVKSLYPSRQNDLIVYNRMLCFRCVCREQAHFFGMVPVNPSMLGISESAIPRGTMLYLGSGKLDKSNANLHIMLLTGLTLMYGDSSHLKIRFSPALFTLNPPSIIVPHLIQYDRTILPLAPPLQNQNYPEHPLTVNCLVWWTWHRNSIEFRLGLIISRRSHARMTVAVYILYGFSFEYGLDGTAVALKI